MTASPLLISMLLWSVRRQASSLVAEKSKMQKEEPREEWRRNLKRLRDAQEVTFCVRMNPLTWVTKLLFTELILVYKGNVP